MSNSFFRFKKFTIYHDLCAMKVGTDGVLLGAWAFVGDCKQILDVGTGTGLIALMLAQRCNAFINAIDIDKDAVLQAKKNSSLSSFASSVQVQQISFMDYVENNRQQVDLIVSNPPYFSNSLKCPDGKRNAARHNDSLPLASLITGSKQLLSPKGRIALILPFDASDEIKKIARDEGLSIRRETRVIPVAGAMPKRILIEFSTQNTSGTEENQLVIEESRHQYTEEYIALTRDYYLKM